MAIKSFLDPKKYDKSSMRLQEQWLARERLGRIAEQESNGTTFQFSGTDANQQNAGRAIYDQGVDWANEVRKQLQGLSNDRVSGLAENLKKQFGLLDQMGGSETNRINRDFASRAGSIGAKLGGTGLYNSTVQGNMRNGVMRNQQEALGNLGEALRGQRLGAITQNAGQVSQAQGENISAQASLGKLVASMYGDKARLDPRSSMQLSTNSSAKYARSPVSYESPRQIGMSFWGKR